MTADDARASAHALAARYAYKARPRYLLERARERIQATEERRLLLQARAGRDVCWYDEDEPEPLVTIGITTWDRGEVLVERGIESALAQTYERIELLVVSDGPDPRTARLVGGVDDPRVRYIELGHRTLYPPNAHHRWCVSGCVAHNTALSLARGAWYAPCDDDELTPDHVEALLAQARRERLECCYSQAEMEVAPGRWDLCGSAPLRRGHVTHGTLLYSSALRFFGYSTTCWKLKDVHDWDLVSRMQRAGVRIGFLPHVTYRHYAERHVREGRARAARRKPRGSPTARPG